jgi:hypothetical protein
LVRLFHPTVSVNHSFLAFKATSNRRSLLQEWFRFDLVFNNCLGLGDVKSKKFIQKFIN